MQTVDNKLLVVKLWRSCHICSWADVVLVARLWIGRTHDHPLRGDPALGCKWRRIAHVMANTSQSVLQARYTASSERIAVTCRIVSFLRGIQFLNRFLWSLFSSFVGPWPVLKSFDHDICVCYIVDFIGYSTILQPDTRLRLNSAIVLVFIKGGSLFDFFIEAHVTVDGDTSLNPSTHTDMSYSTHMTCVVEKAKLI
jgi:hypothetical protein